MSRAVISLNKKLVPKCLSGLSRTQQRTKIRSSSFASLRNRLISFYLPKPVLSSKSAGFFISKHGDTNTTEK